jgi:5-methylcytosine-specific restriction enzyme A
MPIAPLRACIGSPTCPRQGIYKGRCKEHAQERERTRYNAETRKWYSTEAWKVLRASVLADQPVCAVCRVAASTQVDHTVPHRGEYAKFWDRNNLQGLCATCHGQKTARGE